MNIDYQLVSLVATGVALVGVVAGYLDLRGRERRADGEVEKILRQAREKAEKVLQQAQERALEILEKARLDTEVRSEKLEARLDRAEEKEITDFKKALTGITADLQGEAATVVGQKIDEEMARAREQIEGYKKQKMQEVDSKVQEIVKQVTKTMLGKALDMEKHKQLIVAALEEAKLAHVL